MKQIKQITEKKIWDNFLTTVYTGMFPLFQSWEWSLVQEKLGFKIERLGLFDNKKLIAIALLIEIKAKRGHYMHIRQGPVFANLSKENWEFFLKEIISFSKKKRVSFIRISPFMQENTNVMTFPFPTVRSPIHNMDAQVCWVLEISLSEEELLKGMRKSHRYLIRKAQELPITITQTTKKEDLEKFMPLYQQLAHKKHFVAHKGLKEELEIFGKEEKAKLFLAKFEGKVICGALIDFVGNMAIYRHSASDETYRHIPAMYLLQWKVILEAKKRGKKLYNFWGIAENEQKNHPWYGLTLFKTGFGGRKYEFMHAKDVILSPKYFKTFAIDYLTKLKKGY